MNFPHSGSPFCHCGNSASRQSRYLDKTWQLGISPFSSPGNAYSFEITFSDYRLPLLMPPLPLHMTPGSISIVLPNDIGCAESARP
jgi:hypothetical protein